MAPRALRHHQRKNFFNIWNSGRSVNLPELLFHGKSCFLCRERSRGTGLRAFIKFFSAGYVLFCVPKENQKGRRCPQGMKAPVGLLSRRPVCEANAGCLARQGHGDFDALQPGGDCSLLTPKENQKSASDFDALDPRERGCSPLSTPKRMAPYKKASRFARGFFVFRRFEVACATKRKGNSMFLC